jgi:hypothetical protein
MLRSVGVRVRCHVIDNGGSGGTALEAVLDPRVEVLATSENLGYTGAANEALTRALTAAERADFVVIAAHDAQVKDDALALMCAAARPDPTIGILGPVLTAPALEAGGKWRGWRAAPEKSWNPDVLFEDRDWMSGTLLFLRAECVEAIGGFDERLGSYLEDVDLCLRARNAGWRVGLATAARAAGIGSASANVTVMVDINSVLVTVKHRGVRAAFAILMRYVYWIVRGSVAALVPRRTRERRRASLVHARDHARAIWHLLRHWNLVRDFANDPNRGIRRFQ